ncbi:MAG: EthD domain-containing protein [Pseudomonadales bacterium]
MSRAMCVRKTQLHLAARNDSIDNLCDALTSIANQLAEEITLAKVTVLRAHSDDKMRGTGNMQPLAAAFDASLEILNSPADIDAILKGLFNEADLDEYVHLDLSASLTGENKVFVQSKPTPIRFQYCMRRRADFSSKQYLEYYEQQHAKFGIGMRGIEGYAQFHVEPLNSQLLASSISFGVHNVSSVSELHIADMDTFFTGMAQGIDAGNPGEDEDRFVDRLRSVMWVSDEIYRAGF